MENLSIVYTVDQLLEKTKEELQALYLQIVGSEAKAKDTKQQLSEAIVAKQSEKPVEKTGDPGNSAANELSTLTGDDKIIAENPDASPYELLEKGLTQEGFERLMIQQNDDQQGEQKPADKPTLQENAPEVKEVAANYEKNIAPGISQTNLISQKREEMQSGSTNLDDVKKPELIGKVKQLPGQSLAQSMAAPTLRKGVDLSGHQVSKKGGVKIQKGNGQPEIVSKATAERLVKLDPGVYKILS